MATTTDANTNANANEVTQTQQSTFPKFHDFEMDTILLDKKKPMFSTMSNAKFPLALKAYFFFIFGFHSKQSKHQQVSTELLN